MTELEPIEATPEELARMEELAEIHRQAEEHVMSSMAIPAKMLMAGNPSPTPSADFMNQFFKRKPDVRNDT